MTDNEADDLATRLASMAATVASDPAEAAAILFQAAVAVLVAHFPAEAVVALVAAIGEDAVFGVRDLLGVGAARQ